MNALTTAGETVTVSQVDWTHSVKPANHVAGRETMRVGIKENTANEYSAENAKEAFKMLQVELLRESWVAVSHRVQ